MLYCELFELCMWLIWNGEKEETNINVLERNCVQMLHFNERDNPGRTNQNWGFAFIVFLVKRRKRKA
jgi:hypothetical protein